MSEVTAICDECGPEPLSSAESDSERRAVASNDKGSVAANSGGIATRFARSRVASTSEAIGFAAIMVDAKGSTVAAIPSEAIDLATGDPSSGMTALAGAGIASEKAEGAVEREGAGIAAAVIASATGGGGGAQVTSSSRNGAIPTSV